MADHVEPSKVRGTDAVVHFKILDRPDHLGGGYDHYEVVFEDGSCRASDQHEADPHVTIRVSPVHFLKLAANQASGPTLPDGEAAARGRRDAREPADQLLPHTDGRLSGQRAKET